MSCKSVANESVGHAPEKSRDSESRMTEFARRLNLGVRAARTSHASAAPSEIVTRVLYSVRTEAVVQRCMERQEALRAMRIAQGLCVDCGNREAVPGRRRCAVCLLHQRVSAARHQGRVPHIKHPKPVD